MPIMYGIAFKKSNLRPVGGPAGYLYNLNYGLERIGDTSVRFMAGEDAPKINASVKSRVPMLLREVNRYLYYKRELSTQIVLDDSLLACSTLHFHSTMDLYRARNQLKGYKGKVLLTSHSPVVTYLQILDLFSPNRRKYLKDLMAELAEVDRFAFSLADYIIFPCAEAEECYFNTWDEYPNIREQSKIKYLPTGLKQVSPLRKKCSTRSELGIPPEAFVISFVGRHNEVKGYDVLVDLANRLRGYSDVWFLVAGVEGPMYQPNYPRWVEVGWTNDPHSIISASDVFVLPNRETYFDLVFLEVLCLGIPIIASKTGGNKYFGSIDQGRPSGISLYEDVDELESAVVSLYESDSAYRRNCGEANRALYERSFSAEVFASEYLQLVEGLGAKG